MTLPTTILFDPLQETPAAGSSQNPGPATQTGTEVPGEGTDEEAPPPPAWTSFMPFVLMFAIFWFLLIRPEKKRRKETQEMLSALKKGDRVMTSSGMYARVAQLGEDNVTLEIADGVRAKFSRAAVQSIIDPEASTED